jgi:hypothetical protein
LLPVPPGLASVRKVGSCPSFANPPVALALSATAVAAAAMAPAEVPPMFLNTNFSESFAAAEG